MSEAMVVDVPLPIPSVQQWKDQYADVAALPKRHRIRMAVPNQKVWLKIRALAMERERARIRAGVLDLLRQAGKPMEARDLAELLTCSSHGLETHLGSFPAVRKSMGISERMEGKHPHQFRRFLSFYGLADQASGT